MEPTTAVTQTAAPGQVQALVVETPQGNFICSLADWLASGLSLAGFLWDNGVLPDDWCDLSGVLNVKQQMMSQHALDHLPEWGS